MKTVCITLAILALATTLKAQDKPSAPKAGIRLFTLELHNKRPPHSTGIDTLRAEITVAHKIRSTKPSQTFIGWVIRTGNDNRFYSETWDPMPAYYVVKDVKEL